MVTQGKQMQFRLDNAEAKITDIQNVGKQLTELMTEQGNKIQEQAAAISEAEGTLFYKNLE